VIQTIKLEWSNRERKLKGTKDPTSRAILSYVKNQQVKYKSRRRSKTKQSIKNQVL